MAATAASKRKQARLSFFAGALFFLAGAVWMFTGLHQAGRGNYGLDAMMLAVAVLWISIGGRNRREARALEAAEGLREREA